MKKILMLLCVLSCLALTACSTSDTTAGAPATDAPASDGTPVTTETPATADAPAQSSEPRMYLVVTVANDIYQPIALTEPGRYTITRGDCVNVVEVTADSVRMAESTCDNQDCIYQGTVTLENMDERTLQNKIICIPNEVILELYTYEELKVALPGWEAQE